MLILCAAVLIVLLAACSGDDGGPAETVPAAAPSVTPISGQPSSVQEGGSEVSPKDGVIEIEIRGAQFLQNNLKIKTGESVTLRVTNSDGQAHNLRLAGPDGEYATEDDAVAGPEGIPGGGTAELIFAPAVPGRYTFRCDLFPGTMGGTINAD